METISNNKDYKTANYLAKKYGTPYYIFYPKVLEKNIQIVRTEFTKLYPNFLMGYSFKTNYLPVACNVAKSQGCYAEVVSHMEYELALKLGFTPDNIIFNGPVKDTEALIYAIKNGSIVNLDSEQDILTVLDLKDKEPNLDIKVGLRININLTNSDGQSSVQNGLRFSRFGFTTELLDKYIPELESKNIQINSLHGHTSSSDRGIGNYILISQQLLKVIKKFALKNIEYFNIGGGFFGAPAKGLDLTGRPTFADYAQNIIDYLMKDEWFSAQKPTLVVEPGASILSNTFELCTKIHQVKKIDDKNKFVIVDTSVFEVKPSMHSLNLPFEYLSENDLDSGDEDVFQVVGSTCMEKDIILKDITLQEPKVGDCLVFRGLGAYVMVFNNIFINYLIPIVAVDENGKDCLVRRRQDVKNLLDLYEI